ncbi:acyltransferase [Endozoicomonadaceae bacterium StTr2]
MAFLNNKQLLELGFKKLGKNVLISDKASIYNSEEMIIGDNSRIDDFCVISGKITIGRNVHIAVFCNIAGGEKGITLEDFSGISYGSHIFTQSDDYSGHALTGPTIPTKYKNEAKKEIIIGRHSIVGAGSLILPGVILAEGTSIGALSLVTKSTEEWSIYYGIPAKRAKERSRNLLKLEQEYLSKDSYSSH